MITSWGLAACITGRRCHKTSYVPLKFMFQIQLQLVSKPCTQTCQAKRDVLKGSYVIGSETHTSNVHMISPCPDILSCDLLSCQTHLCPQFPQQFHMLPDAWHQVPEQREQTYKLHDRSDISLWQKTTQNHAIAAAGGPNCDWTLFFMYALLVLLACFVGFWFIVGGCCCWCRARRNAATKDAVDAAAAAIQLENTSPPLPGATASISPNPGANSELAAEAAPSRPNISEDQQIPTVAVAIHR